MAKEVDRLQHILFYRTMAFKLDDIQEVLDNPSFDHQKAFNQASANVAGKTGTNRYPLDNCPTDT